MTEDVLEEDDNILNVCKIHFTYVKFIIQINND